MSKSKSPSSRRASKRPGAKHMLVKSIMCRFAADNPEPRCELYYRTPFQLLLSVALSAQTTDKSVNAAVAAAYDAGLSPASLVALGEQGFYQMIRRIGLAPSKAKRAIAMSHQLLTLHGGEVPNDRVALEALPGVGRKTASVVLGEIFRAPTLAVDTHVYRVGARLGLHREPTADACADVLERIIGPEYLPQAHHWLVLHGRYVCKAIKPACASCLLADLCPSAAPAMSEGAGRTKRGVSPRQLP